MQALKKLSVELRELDLGNVIQRLNAPPAALDFYRSFISANKPVIISGAVDQWPALTAWPQESYLVDKLGKTEVSVAITPQGRADAVVPLSEPAAGAADHCFCLPHEVSMPFEQAWPLLAGRSSSGNVHYLQHQNSNLTEELPQLIGDIDADLPWATEAFGCKPDAVNLWIGNDDSSTSFHKDHYENLYAVVSGEKVFTLLPPCDIYRMYIQPYPLARYQPAQKPVASSALSTDPAACSIRASTAVAPNDDLTRPTAGEQLSASARGSTDDSDSSGGGGCTVPAHSSQIPPLVPVIEEPFQTVPWSGVDPYPADLQEAARKHPLFFDGSLPSPMRCVLKAGEVLYLPSMWWHYVQQRASGDGPVIAVNFWYDMRFDSKFAYFNLVQDLASSDV